MPTHPYAPGTGRKAMGKKTRRKQPHRIGPHGEKRPFSSTANAVRVMEIATGLAEEEYVDGTRGKHAKPTT